MPRLGTVAPGQWFEVALTLPPLPSMLWRGVVIRHRHYAPPIGFAVHDVDTSDMLEGPPSVRVTTVNVYLVDYQTNYSIYQSLPGDLEVVTDPSAFQSHPAETP